MMHCFTSSPWGKESCESTTVPGLSQVRSSNGCCRMPGIRFENGITAAVSEVPSIGTMATCHRPGRPFRELSVAAVTFKKRERLEGKSKTFAEISMLRRPRWLFNSWGCFAPDLPIWVPETCKDFSIFWVKIFEVSHAPWPLTAWVWEQMISLQQWWLVLPSFWEVIATIMAMKWFASWEACFQKSLVPNLPKANPTHVWTKRCGSCASINMSQVRDPCCTWRRSVFLLCKCIHC